MKKTRILLVDDHALLRHGLKSIIQYQKDMEVVGEARNGEEAVRQTAKLKPDVVVMDLMMPKKDGAAATAEIVSSLPGTRVLILTSVGASDAIAKALDAGATGAMMKDSPNSSLIAAIRAVAAGKSAISPEVRRMIARDPPIDVLTPRQVEVLQSLTRGLTNRDIARLLSISEDRVEQHIRSLLEKLGAANRTEAVSIALRKQLLKI